MENLHGRIAAGQFLFLARYTILEFRITGAKLRGHGIHGAAEQGQFVATLQLTTMSEIVPAGFPRQYDQLAQRAHQVVADVVEGDDDDHDRQRQKEDLQQLEALELDLAVALEQRNQVIDGALLSSSSSMSRATSASSLKTEAIRGASCSRQWCSSCW